VVVSAEAGVERQPGEILANPETSAGLNRTAVFGERFSPRLRINEHVELVKIRLMVAREHQYSGRR